MLAKFALLKVPQIKGGSMKIIVTLISIIVFTIMLYLCAWVSVWYKTGVPQIQELRLFTEALVSAQAVAAIGFYSAALVDSNGDGESDLALKRIKDEKSIGNGG